MTFTYNPLDGLDTALAKVRFHVGDTVEDKGPKPENGNFQDEEIEGLVSLEGTWQRAVAACYEVLAALWGPYADAKLGDYSESASQKAERFAALAQKWRDQHGYGAGTGIETVHLTRVDGFSQDVAANEVEESGTEYATD